MRVTARPGVSLNRANFEACCAVDDEVVIDLEALEFIDPYGLVNVACVIADATGLGRPVLFLPPSDSSRARYLTRAGLAPLVERACGVPRLPAIVAKEAPALVEMQHVTVGDAVEAVAELVYDRVGALCSVPAVEGLRWALLELGYNVEEHAGSEGFVVAQVWRQNDGTHNVQMAMGDWGRGISDSLRAAGHEMATDSEYICAAAESRLSSKPKDGGFGLPSTVKEARRLGGHVAVRSGCSKVTFWPGGGKSSSVVEAPTSGTVVELEMRCA